MRRLTCIIAAAAISGLALANSCLLRARLQAVLQVVQFPNWAKAWYKKYTRLALPSAERAGIMATSVGIAIVALATTTMITMTM